MKVIKTISAFVLLGASALSVAGPLLTPTQTQDVVQQQTNFIDSVSFDQFNSTNYNNQPLESVHITFTGSAFSGASTIECDAGGGNDRCEGSAKSQVTLMLDFAGLSLAEVIPLTNVVYDLAELEILDVAAAEDTASVDVWWELGDANPNTAAVLAAFSGVGTIDLDVTANGETVLTNTNGSATQSAVALEGSASVDLHYDYSSATVPVPAPMLLVGLGLVGIRRVMKK